MSVERCGLLHDYRLLYFWDLFLVTNLGEIRLISHRVLFHQRILFIALFLYRLLDSITNVDYAICINAVRLLRFFIIEIVPTHFRRLSAHHQSLLELLQLFHVSALNTC